jgi:hypothetical protein
VALYREWFSGLRQAVRMHNVHAVKQFQKVESAFLRYGMRRVNKDIEYVQPKRMLTSRLSRCKGMDCKPL